MNWSTSISCSNKRQHRFVLNMGNMQLFCIRLLIIWAYQEGYTTDLLRKSCREVETNELNLSTESSDAPKEFY